MLRYYFIGDLHLSDISPRSRIDDYPYTILEKLDFIFDKAKQEDIKAIFFLGDIFHKPSGLSTRYINKVIESFQKAPCECYTIIGNHDIPYNRVEDVDNTSLGILFKAGVLKHLRDPYLIAKDIAIFGYDYNTDISFISKPDTVQTGICLSHSYGEDVSFGSSERAEFFKWSLPNINPFDVYILGHDHSKYQKETIYEHSDLYRFGALSRLTSATTDTQRSVQIMELVFDQGLFNFNLLDVKYKPANECFSTHSLNKEKINTVDFNSSLEDVLSNLNFTIQSSVFDIIDEIVEDDKIKQVIENYLKNNFIERHKGEASGQ